MAMKVYTNDFPKKIIDRFKELNLITEKDKLKGFYVNSFLKNIREAVIITEEKIIHWFAKIYSGEKKIINLKKVKELSYTEKGLYSHITYYLSSKKSYEIKLNRQDGEKIYNLSQECWKNIQNTK